ncbi:MAG: hypothetical protein LQ337_005558 [Flavoplaca oasis]|nr:MAG: hypothetical protein LQ337_005558 [Flavoplaca oasis]
MSSFTSKATSSLARYRPAILALTAIAAGCTIYAVSKNLPLFPASGIGTSQPSGGSLHRSNAQRRRCLRRRRPIATGTEPQTEAAPEIGVVISYGQKYNNGKRVFGTFEYTNASTGKTHLVWLAPHQLPSIQYIQEEWNITVEEASSLRWHMEIKLLDSFFAQEMPPEPPIPLTEHVKEGFSIEFAATAQIPPSLVSCAIERYEMGNLQDHPARSAQEIDSNSPRPTQLSISSSDDVSTGTLGDLSAVFSIFHDSVIGEAPNGGHHIAETESIQSDGAGDDQNKPPDNQNLMNLCYRIAEDQAKRESFVHRGVNCNSCNAMPIRGIRYRCSNCPDYDLCEQCESMQIHDKTHIFYKVRIPAPLQSNPRKSAPVWYPGNPNNVGRNLNRELQKTLSTKTGIPERQVDAAWEQFQCLASADFLEDPYGFGIAINRRDFDKSFIPSAASGFSPANLIYDQTFSFYDTNKDGLIDFEELLHGIACIRNEGSKLREKIFQSYDLDADGFVSSYSIAVLLRLGAIPGRLRI